MTGEVPVPQTFPLHITADEAQQLVTLLDAATKASGLQAALIAVPLFHKLHAAANAPAPDALELTEEAGE